jgi:hypothetical protein
LREEFIHEVEVVIVCVLLVVAVDQVQELVLRHLEDIFEVFLQFLFHFKGGRVRRGSWGIEKVIGDFIK